MFSLLCAEMYSTLRSSVEGNKVVVGAPLSNGYTQSFGEDQMPLVIVSVLLFL